MLKMIAAPLDALGNQDCEESGKTGEDDSEDAAEVQTQPSGAAAEDWCSHYRAEWKFQVTGIRPQ